MKKISDNNYVTIQGWMLRLGLSNMNEVAAYAIVYGFSQDSDSEFKGSISYMAEWLMCSKPTVTKIMNSLVEKGLITKKQVEVNGVKFNRYKIISSKINELHVKEFYGGSKDSLQGGSKEILQGSKDSLHNNTNDNNNLNISNSPINSPIPSIKTDNKIDNKEYPSNSPKILDDVTGEEVSVKDIMDYWNNRTNGVFQSIRDISGARKTHLMARLRDSGVQEFYHAIDMAMGSRFLRGENKNNWRLTFDWLVNESNFNKVLEGNYADRDNNTGANGEPDLSKLTEQERVLYVAKQMREARRSGQSIFDFGC